jgi:hypothetical protein
MSHHKIGNLLCLLAFVAGIGWSQTAAAETSERDLLQQMLKKAEIRLAYIDQYISQLELKMVSTKVEIDQREADYLSTGLEDDMKAWLEAVARYEELAKALDVAEADRAEVVALIKYLKAKLRALGPAPRLGPAPTRGQSM